MRERIRTENRRVLASLAGLATAAVFAGAVTAATQPVATAAVSAASRASVATAPASGTWRELPASPIAPNTGLTSVWTGTQMLLFGRLETLAKGGALLTRTNVAAAYDPAARRWRRLRPPGTTRSFMDYHSVWTGREMLVLGQGTHEAFNPRSNRWRQLPLSPLLAAHAGFGLVVWTGHELIGWGGGCCGDAFSNGVAYSPVSNRWRALATSPLAGSQGPIGAWTGRELLVFVGNLDPNGRPWPATLSRAAAYDPTSDSWRRIAPMPVAGGAAVWNGRELLVVGGGANGRSALAYDPSTNRWRALAPLPSSRVEAATVWTGKRLLLWGGATAAANGRRVIAPHGLAYDPRANRWSALASAPLAGRLRPTAVWTGRAMIVWGGGREKRPPAGGGIESLSDGAAYTPSRR